MVGAGERGETIMAEHRAPTAQRRRPSQTRNDTVRFEVLGTVTVRKADPAPLMRASHRRLLAIMLLDAERRLTTGNLIDRFWRTHPPATAKATIHTHMSALRRQLPVGTIMTEGDGYRLALDTAVLDSNEFTELLRLATAHARRHDWQAALDAADAAIGLWHGDPFGELADDHFAVAQIARLNEMRALAFEARAESLLQLGRPNEALPDLEWTVCEFPLRETFSRLLARARQQTGSHAEALRALRRIEAALADLGLEPSPALRALEQQILTHAADANDRDQQCQPLRSA